MLVGPDNGLLTLAAERFGGVAEALDISRSPLALERVSASFHGRDLFAPVAAQLAAGVAVRATRASRWTPAELVALASPHTRGRGRRRSSRTCCTPTTSATSCSTPSARTSTRAACAPGSRCSSTASARCTATTFADVAPGALLLYEDSYGALALAVNRGSALDALGLEIYGRVQIARDA